MLCFHKYTTWSELVGAYAGVFQYRHCTKCGKLQKRRVGCNNDFNLLVWNKKNE